MKIIRTINRYSLYITYMVFTLPFLALLFLTDGTYIPDNIADSAFVDGFVFFLTLAGIIFTFIQSIRLWNYSFWHRMYFFIIFLLVATIIYTVTRPEFMSD